MDKVCTYCLSTAHRASNCPKRPRERDIERYLGTRVKELGGEIRKVQWVGRQGAPDRLVMLPPGIVVYPGPEYGHTIWVEVKNPETIKTFPANAHERAQHREHERMRKLGQHVEVIGTFDQVDEVLR